MIQMLNADMERLLKKRKIIAPISILLITLYLVNFGANEYLKIDQKNKNFIKFESDKISRYLTYDQLGAQGFRLLFQPSSLIIFFETHKLLKSTECKIDCSEIINISEIYKGRSIFYEGSYNDFSGIIIIFGALYMAYMGLINFKEGFFTKLKMKPIQGLGSILCRLMILNLIFVFIFILNYIYVLLKGITFTPKETSIFFYFCLYALLYLTFFYGIGLFVSFVFKSYKKLWLFVICLAVIFVVPEINNIGLINDSEIIPSNESLENEKFGVLMEAEKKIHNEMEKLKKENKDTSRIWKPMAIKYWGEVFKINQKKEKHYHSIVLDVIKTNEKRSILFPTITIKYLSKESSSKGYRNYNKILNKSMDTRKGFINYYIKKRYIEEASEVKPYIDIEDQIIQPEIELVNTFWISFLITALYILVLFLASYFILIRRRKKKKETFDPGLEMEEGDMVYVLCKNDENENYLDKIYNHYQQKENIICVDKIKGEDIDPGISLYQTARYFCKQMNARWDRTREHIEKLGIKDLKKEKRSLEAIKKIYCAVCIAVEADTIVFKDFIKQESRKFERQFLALLKDTMDMDRTIIYLGTDPLLLDSPFTGQEGVDKFRKYDIDDPLKFILR